MTDGPTFEYAVNGRPVSTQPQSRTRGGKAKKSPALPAWRNVVKQAFKEAWEDYSKEYFVDYLRLELVWIFDAQVPNVPDLDNIVKPFIDTPEGALYENDIAFREMHLFKFELNETRTVNASSEKLIEALASQREFIYIRITPISTRSARPLSLLILTRP